MDKSKYCKICSMKKDKGKWQLYDWNGEAVNMYIGTRFSSSMTNHYRNNRKNNSMPREDSSVVWVMIGINNDEQTWIQVGRTANLTNLLRKDILEDIKEILNKNGKYYKEGNKYSELIFYEVNIDRYLEDDKIFLSNFGKKPKDTYLELAYFVLRAAYVEGKLAHENNPTLFHSSTIDRCFINYFKNSNK